jgi:Rrf2 family protein
MRLLNRDSDYALRALLAIAARPGGEIAPVSGLAEKLDIPRPYLRKIMQTLARNGIVVSQKGRGGGFVLGRRPDEIRLADVLRIFQGDIGFRDCLFKKNICHDFQTCPLRRTLGKLGDRLVRELEAVSVASLLREGPSARVRDGAPGRREGRSHGGSRPASDANGRRKS